MDKKIEELFTDFDFERVARLHVLENWTWWFPTGVRFPTSEDLKEHCMNLYKDLTDDRLGSEIDAVSSHRFRVSRYTEIEKFDVLHLEFIYEVDTHYIGEN